MDFLKGEFAPGILLNGQYETVSPLNHGSFGMVFMANEVNSGDPVAIKCLAKPSAGLGLSSGICVDDKSEELKIHTCIGFHPNVVNLVNAFETDTHSYLVLEYCSMGDLYEAIRLDKGPKKTDHVRGFMLQLIDAVEALHHKGIYHRDIKPENIFLTDNGDMKLGDFGLATTDVWSYDIAVGSDRYMAPEQFDPQGNGLSPGKADVWSIGICLLNILFSRNPFGAPAMSDPLFQDYVRDRQSLFDVFPNMSQDTFEVLTHCLALDPEKRSLALARDALHSVISFTTDDESLDEFCTENRDVVTATAHREPLRTPSIVSPPIEQGEAFPWAQALHSTTPKHMRQLSAIPDNESCFDDMFPDSEVSVTDWNSKADTRSFESAVDSGLGISVGSDLSNSPDPKVSRSKPLPIAGSLPALGGRASNALSSIFGRKRAFESKSWSDMWEEDEEERVESERKMASRGKPPKPSQLSQIDSESDGRSTPRACLAEIKNPSATNARPQTSVGVKPKDDKVSQHTGFVFEDHIAPPRYSPPTKRSLIDKWSALGEYRKGTTPMKSAQSSDNLRSRFNPSSWRRNTGKSINRHGNTRPEQNILQKKQWNLSTDWRNDQQPFRSSPLRPLGAAQLDGSMLDINFPADVGSDSEWVGGWTDLHL